MTRPRSNWFIVLIYGILLGTGGHWIRQKMRFAGVRDWPSVEARVVGSESASIRYQHESRQGYRSGWWNVSRISFEYLVDGRLYQGKLATPDGGGLNDLPAEEHRRAYYKPGSPEVAVLFPTPYQGNAWLLAALVCALLAAFHGVLTIPDWFAGPLRARWSTVERKEPRMDADEHG